MFYLLAGTGKFLSIKYVQPWGIALEFYTSEESSPKEELCFRELQFHAPIFSSEPPSRRLHHVSAPHYCILDFSQPEAFAKLCASLPDLTALKLFLLYNSIRDTFRLQPLGAVLDLIWE